MQGAVKHVGNSTRHTTNSIDYQQHQIDDSWRGVISDIVVDVRDASEKSYQLQ